MANDPIVDATALSGLGPIRYLDARDQAAFDAGAAPNAVRVASDAWDIAAKAAGVGFHDLAHWEREIAALGLDDTMLAAVYDNGGMTNAARVWFMLQHYGARAVIINGGWPAMQSLSLPAGLSASSTPFRAR